MRSPISGKIPKRSESAFPNRGYFTVILPQRRDALGPPSGVSAKERKLRVLPVIFPGGGRPKESELPGFPQGTT